MVGAFPGARVSATKSEKVTAARERDRIEEKLRRLKRLYRDLELDEPEYEMGRNRLEVALASIVVPQENATMKAGQELSGMRPQMRRSPRC